MSTIKQRAKHLLGTNFFEEPNSAEYVAPMVLSPPVEDQYVLRCPLVVLGQPYSLPNEMNWCADFIQACMNYQLKVIGVNQPYMYLTIRHGKVISETDDEWHVDGFSMKVPHIPEQNYIWTSANPTEITSFGLHIPDDFDPLHHNLQLLIQDSLPTNAKIATLEPQTIYAMDPYVFHRRPTVETGQTRTFLRLSFTPIPIDDVNNHTNPAFGKITTSYDGVKDFRDKLSRYVAK
ncbi:hypothetical protein KC878_03355 [Candidatus Saccharibacteria bacterium]|nr:hypothetical protein [Candidatus Saccharibacteria bacterium]MCB9820988.1 hypothetical protein [Candidatus Nomurabacteria bacterium]